jgi:putative SOS response-associated peptidase YedK
MCGRMTMTLDLDDVAEQLGATFDPSLREAYKKRYNLPPTDPHVVAVRADGGRRLEPMKWGLAPPGKKIQINARAETVNKIGIFKRSFEERRCLIPADGFFEWTGAKARRRPIWFHAPPGRLLVFAGIYDAQGFCVLTVPANADVAPVHDRMPAILAGDQAEAWLREPDVTLLAPAPKGALLVTPVSSRANSVANDDPGCLGPPENEQLSL